MAKIIGVIPASSCGDMTKSTASDVYRLANNYSKCVQEAGGTPVCLAPVDNWVKKDALKLFDGYIVQGGAEFYPYHFQVIHDAVENHKRFLGICLGEQLIYAYFALRKLVEERGYEGDLVEAICALLQEKGPAFSVLESVEGHNINVFMPRGGEDVVKHDVTTVPGTILHRVTGKDTLRAASFHKKIVPPGQDLVTVNAWAAGESNVVEGVEYGDNLLGVQFHPEVDGLLPEIFTFLME